MIRPEKLVLLSVCVQNAKLASIHFALHTIEYTILFDLFRDTVSCRDVLILHL